MIKKCRMNVDSVFKGELSKLNNVSSPIAKGKSSNFQENLKKFLKNTNISLGVDSITLRDKDIRNYFSKGMMISKSFYRILAKIKRLFISSHPI